MKLLFPLFGLLILGGCSLLPSHVGHDDHDHTASELADPNHHDHDMMDHSDHSMDHANMVVDEVSFISEMIPHHQEAVDSSLILLSQTQNPELQPILSNIIYGQNNEITMMKKRLSDRYPDSDYTPMYMPMMREFRHISSIATAEQMYMQDMIIHHQGAVDMAEKLLAIFAEQDPLIRLTEEGLRHRNELKIFAQAIIETQTAEIQMFEELLKAY